MKQEDVDSHKVDRSGWTSGPWDLEPDRLDFEHNGIPCLMLRHPTNGNWCGHAAVAAGHPYHGKEYDDVQAEVHGGLTYANHCGGSICHVPKPGDPDEVYWFGFDCSHCDDLSPGMRRYGQLRAYEVYRDMAYVRAEVERLAEQLLVAGGATMP